MFADGWNAFGFSREQLAAFLRRAQRWPEWQSRRDPIDLVLTPERLIDVSMADRVAVVVDLVAQYHSIDANMLNL